MLAALAMRTDLTPAEQKILNQFLRGSNKIADWYQSVGKPYIRVESDAIPKIGGNLFESKPLLLLAAG